MPSQWGKRHFRDQGSKAICPGELVLDRELVPAGQAEAREGADGKGLQGKYTGECRPQLERPELPRFRAPGKPS